MQRCLCLGLLLGLSAAVWAQQNQAPTSPPSSSSPSSPSQKQDASGLSRDTSFPEDDPAAQRTPPKEPSKKQAPNLEPPRSDRVQVDDLGSAVGESSSKDTQVDLSPPADDAKVHPQSSAAIAAAEAGGPGGITELKSWDPHKAAKDVEVGDFYFKRKNYHAAEDRYREALLYKDNDAVATIRLAECLEKQGIWDDARAEYESYLKILPHGAQASEAKKAIDRLKAQAGAKQPQ
jgi:tetratricopeptide (TPR) repeat protein